MYFFYQHLVFVNLNNFKSCLVLSELYSKLFILCSHSACWFGFDFFFFYSVEDSAPEILA